MLSNFVGSLGIVCRQSLFTKLNSRIYSGWRFLHHECELMVLFFLFFSTSLNHRIRLWCKGAESKSLFPHSSKRKLIFWQVLNLLNCVQHCYLQAIPHEVNAFKSQLPQRCTVMFKT